MAKRFFAAMFVVGCALLPVSAAASLITIQGHAAGELANVLFNSGDLIDSGLTVTGLTSGSAILVDFVEDSTVLVTPSSGQARVAGQEGAAFDWLQVMAHDPLTVFYRFEANLKLTGPAKVRITTLGTSAGIFEFLGGNGENRFGVTADGGDSISSVLIETPEGDYITDARQIRIGSTTGEVTVGAGGAGLPPVEATALIANPEPGTLLMLATGLLGAAHMLKRRQRGR